MKKFTRAFLQGRLGNQLFVYATARAAQEKYLNGEGDLIFDDYRHVKNNSLLNYTLTDNVRFEKVYMGKFKEVIFYNTFEKHILRSTPEKGYEIAKKYQKFYNFCGLYLCENGYLPLPDKINGNLDMYGYFQCEKYFKELRPMLLKEFTPKYPVLEKNLKLLESIKNTESCCLAVRLGDYVNNPTHQICTKEYYQMAIDKIIELYPNCVFYLFSDTIELAKESLMLPANTVFEAGNDPDYETLRLMSNCKHFILSNSSFSWWAQWLSENENKTVIAPERWFNNNLPCAIYQDNWICLPVFGSKL